MITVEQSQTLRAPFTVAQHEFLNGFTYIREGDICNRIEDVDPAWSFEVLSMERRETVAGITIVCTARLTICGVSRDGVGMASVTISQKKDYKTKQPIEGTEFEANEAEKSAATDALKRAARLFGIGRYLLNAENVKDERSLQQFLNSLNADTPSTPRTERQQDNPPPPAPQPKKRERVDNRHWSTDSRNNSVMDERLELLADASTQAKVDAAVKAVGSRRDYTTGSDYFQAVKKHVQDNSEGFVPDQVIRLENSGLDANPSPFSKFRKQPNTEPEYVDIDDATPEAIDIPF